MLPKFLPSTPSTSNFYFSTYKLALMCYRINKFTQKAWKGKKVTMWTCSTTLKQNIHYIHSTWTPRGDVSERIFSPNVAKNKSQMSEISKENSKSISHIHNVCRCKLYCVTLRFSQIAFSIFCINLRYGAKCYCKFQKRCFNFIKLRAKYHEIQFVSNGG